jgi:Ca-activated chloride channel family protein
MAVEQKIKIYTIAVGSFGKVPFPYFTADGKKAYRYDEADIDETLLKQVAERTGGKYFRATDPKSLGGLFENINLLEKSEFEALEYRTMNPVVYPLLIPAALIGLCYVFLTIRVIRLP